MDEGFLDRLYGVVFLAGFVSDAINAAICSTADLGLEVKVLYYTKRIRTCCVS